ncbi:TauD/TfdA family dioxygenase [Bacillus mycoides]|uniref:TauD/TfdA family dioxygenase n=1 Tax=Bacillus mycoides TaxID=1405 RepID=UPI0018798AC8|nr:TauD/TfdA family dioxygenase [Bacillus mycoides]MBE7150863.1 TauD/TfdA family dioxygenase [Bacillus mycoides]
MKTKPEEKTQIILSQLKDGQNLPLVIRPAVDSFNLTEWATNNREWIDQKLIQHGGILFRDCNVGNMQSFESFTSSISSGLENYTERSTPRSEVQGKVYTSTEYPADQYIPLHNEMSYAFSWPKKIWFYSIKVAESGGETPIADSREVLKKLDPAIVEKFARKKIMYVRNYMPGLDLPWEVVFQTKDKQVVEDYCHKTNMTWEWKADGSLKTVAIRDALAKHPITGELLWFNQAHLFHVTSLPNNVWEQLIIGLGEENLPRNTYYGDGTPIEPEVLMQIRNSFDEAAISFPWKEGDVLMLDNHLVAHGRAPFQGTRKVVVTMADLTNERNLGE